MHEIMQITGLGALGYLFEELLKDAGKPRMATFLGIVTWLLGFKIAWSKVMEVLRYCENVFHISLL